MSSLREIYKWYDEFNDKSLTPPPSSARFIDVVLLDEENARGGEVSRHAQFETLLPFACSECFAANLINVEQLVNRDGDHEIKNVFELTLRIKNELIKYLPGDTIGILPRNSEDCLNEIINNSPDLKTKFNDKIQLKLLPETSSLKRIPKIPIFLPTQQTTLNQLFEECVDLNAFPKKSFIWSLVQNNCLTDATERRFLEILASREGSALYTAEILQKQFTFFKLLKHLTSWQLNIGNIGVLLEHLPRLMPRPYSISNSLFATETSNAYDNQSTILKIIFSINDPPGITTSMLQKLIAKHEDAESSTDLSAEKLIVNLYFRKNNQFRLTEDDLNRPLIMIAIGTGVAPFIGFLEHISELKKRTSAPLNDKKSFSWLLFGCKRKNKQLCSDRIGDFLADGTLSKFNECFSRDTNSSSSKYVQDVIKNNADEFISLLLESVEGEAPAKIFVCGNKPMATGIQTAIQESLVNVGKCSTNEDAKNILNEIIKSGQYIEDVWI